MVKIIFVVVLLEKSRRKKINYLRIIGHLVAGAIVFYIAWEQYSMNGKEIKVEQVGKSLDNFFE